MAIREKILKSLAKSHANHPWRMLIVVAILTIIFGAFAEEAVPKIKASIDPKDKKPFVKRVDYKQEIDFIRNHGLILIKADDLKNMKDVYKNPNLVPLLTNINNSLEKEYVGREKSLSTREKEDGAFIFLDGIENLINTMRLYVEGNGSSRHLSQSPPNTAQQAVDRLLTGEPYILSYDKTTLILNVIPNFTMMDLDKLVSGVDLPVLVLPCLSV